MDLNSKERIVIAGGSGFLGRSPAHHLVERHGSEVVLLTRHEPAEQGPWRFQSWDARTLGDWKGVLDGATALVNLVENAVKYSSPGDSVSVRARLDDDGVALVVQDTGRGIPARDLDRIFERFYRVDRSRDAATGGTGIGLSIVRHVALNHGGHVSVASFEGDGSSFTLVLPVVPPGRAEPGQSPEPQTAHEVG